MEFSDIPKDHWAYDAVNLVCSKGIMSGYGDNTFRGNNPVTKYEAALMICNFLHLSDKKQEDGYEFFQIIRLDDMSKNIQKLEV